MSLDGQSIARRLERLELREADRDAEIGRLAGSHGRAHDKTIAVCSALGERLDAHTNLVHLLTKRVDELYYDIEQEMRPRLNTLNDEIDAAKADAEDTGKHAREAIAVQAESMAKVQRLAVVVGRLNRERKARAESEREARRYKRLARGLLLAMLTAAAMVAGGTAMAVSLHRCGVPAPLIQHEVTP